MAAATQHAAAGARGQVGDGVEEPGLADAGLALDQQQAGLARRGEPGPGPLDLRQLGLAAHEERTLDVVRRPARSAGSAASRSTERCRSAGLAVGSRAEVLAQACGQVVVRRERRRCPAVGHQRAHQGADGLLVERIRRRRPRRPPGPPRRVPGRSAPRRAGGGRGDAVSRPRGGRRAPSRRRPRRPAPAGCRAGSSAARAAAAASTGSPAAARAAASVASRAASSRSTSHGPRAASPYERPVAVSRSAPEQPAGAADQGGHVGRGIGRRVLGPQRLDDAVERDQRAALGGQQREQGAGLAAAELPSASACRRPARSTRERRGEPDPGRPAALLHASSMRQPAIRLRFGGVFLAQRRRRIG